MAQVISSTTKGELYLIAEDTLEKMEIQFVPPEISYDTSPNISEIAIVGRNAPELQYIGNTTTVEMELDFHANDEDREDVISKVLWLQSLSMNDGNDRKAQRVKIVFGKLFKNKMWVVRAAPAKLSQFNPNKGWLPQQAYVKIRFTLDTDHNPTWEEMRFNNGNHYGLTG